MAEHVLRGEIAVYPRVEGGRHVLVNDTGEIYRIPMSPEAFEKFRREMSLSDEELEASILRREAGKNLVVPEPQVVNGAGRA